MTVQEMKNEILRLKRENDICILVHAYQSEDILEVADFIGDSFGLSERAAEAKQNNVLICGVRFMAETAKILSPHKTVLLSNAGAGCPMAEQMDKKFILELKEKYPGYAIAAYINTTAELKTVCDVCVTSSSAVKVIKNLDNKNVIFIPDCNLGEWVAKQLPEKNIKLFNGGCPTHLLASADDVKAARAAHPDALLLVHPECKSEVTSLADFAGSTTEIMAYAKKSDANEFIIGTENSIVEHLQFECPHKLFYPLSKHLYCHDMRLTTLSDVYNAVSGRIREEIVLDAETIRLARRPIDEMLRLGAM